MIAPKTHILINTPSHLFLTSRFLYHFHSSWYFWRPIGATIIIHIWDVFDVFLDKKNINETKNLHSQTQKKKKFSLLIWGNKNVKCLRFVYTWCRSRRSSLDGNFLFPIHRFYPFMFFLLRKICMNRILCYLKCFYFLFFSSGDMRVKNWQFTVQVSFLPSYSEDSS